MKVEITLSIGKQPKRIYSLDVPSNIDTVIQGKTKQDAIEEYVRKCILETIDYSWEEVK